ncbi:MAG: Permease [Candidatus Magasanikbacteria bacterium GW2011_GWC2_37_14]|uniref:Permease n=1 Tax=Candidatus Magasanikbacteria bacterium GW2011_GWC2_37_14 TaxID=1619046 RepID=A0A0G0GPZ6_9BACT|nr:MAG: Permease [Candidatus Magasanikbacteria bacterium GW2011_GWC2_37_14]
MLKLFSNFITSLFITTDTRLYEVVSYFIYDVIKILLLLAVMIFVVSVLRTFLPKEKIKNILAKRHPFWSHLLAGLFGIITPFCSCSAVPLFLGFVEAGIPLSATFTFLIASPMINEIAIALLWSMFGIKIALLYVISGLIVAILAGWIIGKFKAETLLESLNNDNKSCDCTNKQEPTWKERFFYALSYTKKIVKKVWLYIIIGVGLGAWIHGYVPTNFLAQYAGVNVWYAVPLATLIGIPLYSNAAGVVPLVSVLVEKGVGVGTALALMMAVTALSLPEFMILKRIMKNKLLVIFASVMFVGIVVVGYLFNFLLK